VEYGESLMAFSSVRKVKAYLDGELRESSPRDRFA